MSNGVVGHGRSVTRLRRAAVAVAAVLTMAGCGGGDGSSCVDFDPDQPPMGADLVALSEAVTDLPDGFETDPPVPRSLTLEGVSDVVAAADGYELEVENAVTVVLVGDVGPADVGIYRSVVGGCSEAGFSSDPSDEEAWELVVGFTGDRAVRFLLEDGRLTISEYDA